MLFYQSLRTRYFIRLRIQARCKDRDSEVFRIIHKKEV